MKEIILFVILSFFIIGIVEAETTETPDKPEVTEATSTIKTKEETISWLEMQSDNRVSYNQCTDFVKAYVNWLMSGNSRATNVWPKNQTGNAIQISTNKLWGQLGWEVIDNKANPDYVPEPGDILVSKGSMPQYGHTGVVLESKSVSRAVIVDANYSGKHYAYRHEESWSKTYEAFYFIKPKFAEKPVFNYSLVDGDFYLKNVSTNKYLTVEGLKDENKANIYVDEFFSRNQVVAIKSDKYNNHKIVPEYSKRGVNAWGDYPGDGANVNLFNFVSNDPGTQVWKFEKVDNGYIIHLAFNENLCMAVDGDDVIIEKVDGGINQVWQLEEASSKVITDLSNFVVSNIERQAYTGKEIKPKVEVYDGAKLLEEGVHYTLRYEDNVDVGKAKVIIEGRAYYSGEIVKEFMIYKEYTGDDLLGDLNKSGAIDLTDVLMMLRAYFNGETIDKYQNADMNGNNMIDLTDILMLLRVYFDSN